jgi:uncharacterized protein YigE (DUF2233 family)
VHPGGGVVHDPPACVQEWTPVAEGIDYRAWNCVDLHLVRVDLAKAEVDAVIQGGGTAAGVAQRGGYAFALNANFFDDAFQPLGLVIAGGKKLHALQPVSWESVFYVDRERRPHIVLPASWRERDARVALQAGPRLVTGGKPLAIKRATADWRSGVCIPDDAHAIFFATPHESQFDMAQIAKLAVSIGCREAMLFDGGPSAQLWVRGRADVAGDKRVPVFAVGRPRSLSH